MPTWMLAIPYKARHNMVAIIVSLACEQNNCESGVIRIVFLQSMIAGFVKVYRHCHRRTLGT